MTSSKFWKEREEEFRQHVNAENRFLAADWQSITDTWTFRGGSGERSERIFKSLACKAASGLNGILGADASKTWLDRLRRGEYASLRFNYQAVDSQERRDYLAQTGEAVPVVEGIHGDVTLPDGSVEAGMRLVGTIQTIEGIFETSADFCLELDSHTPPDTTEVIAPDASSAGVAQPNGGRCPSVLRRRQKNGGIEGVRVRARKMLAEGATHQEVCQRLKDADRPARAEWRHLSWDKAYMWERFRGSVCKWLSKNCRP
jgi:hypothetical protein